jgi:hypothetical protein
MITSATGSYRIPGLVAGTYNLRVVKPGFAERVYRRLTVTVNGSLVLDVVLAVSTVNEEVTVSGDPTLFKSRWISTNFSKLSNNSGFTG